LALIGFMGVGTGAGRWLPGVQGSFMRRCHGCCEKIDLDIFVRKKLNAFIAPRYLR
jgi:hypothetical protein